MTIERDWEREKLIDGRENERAKKKYNSGRGSCTTGGCIRTWQQTSTKIYVPGTNVTGKQIASEEKQKVIADLQHFENFEGFAWVLSWQESNSVGCSARPLSSATTRWLILLLLPAVRGGDYLSIKNDICKWAAANRSLIMRNCC